MSVNLTVVKHYDIEKQCSICLVNLGKEERIISHIKEGEKHPFHEKCLMKWLEEKSACPICRVWIDQKFNISLRDRVVKRARPSELREPIPDLFVGNVWHHYLARLVVRAAIGGIGLDGHYEFLDVALAQRRRHDHASIRQGIAIYVHVLWTLNNVVALEFLAVATHVITRWQD